MATNAPARESVNGAPAEPPTEPYDYAALNAVFGALLAAVVLSARERASERDPLTARDLAVTSAATFALAKVIAKERIGSWVREPFVEDEDGERPRGRRLRHAVGELITCPFCLGPWIATALTGGLVLAPRLTRAATATFTAVAISDHLQLIYAQQQKAAS